MASEVIFVRCPPELKAAIELQVESLNKSRPLGDPEITVNSFVLGCLWTLFDHQAVNGHEAAETKKKAAKVAKVARKARRK